MKPKLLWQNVRSFVVLALIFLTSLSFELLTMNPVNAFECCVTDGSPSCLSSGTRYTLQQCPGSQQECYLKRSISCTRQLCCASCGVIVDIPVSRPYCNAQTGVWIRFGCGNDVVTSWNEWDMDFWLNPIIGCNPANCYCDEDFELIAREQLGTGSCEDDPCE